MHGDGFRKRRDHWKLPDRRLSPAEPRQRSSVDRATGDSDVWIDGIRTASSVEDETS